MGVTAVVALVVIFIGFPLMVYASFRIVLSADRSDPDRGADGPGGGPDGRDREGNEPEAAPDEPDGPDRRNGPDDPEEP